MSSFLEEVNAARAAWRAAHPGEQLTNEGLEALIGEVRAKRPLPERQKTDEELEQLAQGAADGTIWLETGEDLERLDSSFRPVLAVAGPAVVAQLFDEQATLFYEDLAKASPLAVNHRPMFLSFKWLNATDHTVFRTKVDALLAKLEALHVGERE